MLGSFRQILKVKTLTDPSGGQRASVIAHHALRTSSTTDLPPAIDIDNIYTVAMGRYRNGS